MIYPSNDFISFDSVCPSFHPVADHNRLLIRNQLNRLLQHQANIRIACIYKIYLFLGVGAISSIAKNIFYKIKPIALMAGNFFLSRSIKIFKSLTESISIYLNFGHHEVHNHYHSQAHSCTVCCGCRRFLDERPRSFSSPAWGGDGFRQNLSRRKIDVF